MKEKRYTEFQFSAAGNGDRVNAEAAKEMMFQVVRMEMVQRSYQTEAEFFEPLPGLFTRDERDKIVAVANRYSEELEKERSERERLKKVQQEKRPEHPNY